MVSRIDELKKLIIAGRKPTANLREFFVRKANKKNLTDNEKRQLKNLVKKAKENVFDKRPFLGLPAYYKDFTLVKK